MWKNICVTTTETFILQSTDKLKMTHIENYHRNKIELQMIRNEKDNLTFDLICTNFRTFRNKSLSTLS